MITAPYLHTGTLFNHSRNEFIRLFPDSYRGTEKEFDKHSMQATLAKVALVVSTIFLIPLLLGIPQYFYRKVLHHSEKMEAILKERIDSCRMDYERNFRLKIYTDKDTYTHVYLDDLKTFLNNNCFSTYEQFRIFTDISQACASYPAQLYCKELFTDRGVIGGESQFQFYPKTDGQIKLDFQKGGRSITYTSTTKILDFRNPQPFPKCPVLQRFRDNVRIDHRNDLITIERLISV